MENALSQCGQRFYFDVVIIGSGIAGMCYGLSLLKERPQTRLAFITKGKLGEGNSQRAQGGIAAAALPEDIESHVQDTLLAGDGLCAPDIVQALLREGPDGISYLQALGVKFDEVAHGQLEHNLEAGHSTRRICHISDSTGQAIIQALVKALEGYAPNNGAYLTHTHPKAVVTVFEQHIAVNLIRTLSTRRKSSTVVGVYVLSEASGLIHTFSAKVVVLATGGAGKVYRYTSNSPLATGDGVAMAWRAGARVGGMEFYQFHPTLLYHYQENHFLISEVLRGEGAYLRRPGTGERFMCDYAPESMELATRDIVSRAIFSEIEQHDYGFVMLDSRHLDSHFLKQRFPTIYNTLAHYGIEMQRDLIPVVPAAHYMGGGIVTDTSGSTDINRLLAIGETALTGLHGANRLASNSLLEGVVMGRLAALKSLPWIASSEDLPSIPDWNSGSAVDLRRASQINAHWRGLRGEMTSYAGIVRTQAGLTDQLCLIKARRRMIEHYYWQHRITPDLIELRNIALVAELIVRCALLREESRGGHFREDYPSRAQRYFDTILNYQSD